MKNNMKKLFFYMIINMVVPLNGMENNHIVPTRDTDLSIHSKLILLERKIDAMGGVIQSQAHLVDTIGKNMILLMKAYKDHADVVDRASAATDNLTEALDRQSNLYEILAESSHQLMSKKEERQSTTISLQSIFQEVAACTDAVDTCIEDIEKDQEKIEKKYQSLENSLENDLRSLQRQIKALQRRVNKRDHNQEQTEATDPHDKRD